MNDPSAAAAGAKCSAAVATPRASRYLQQLCKHFAHKLPVTFDETAGRIPFSMGDCRLSADQGRLVLSLAAADADRLPQLQDVVARHLERFAFREDLHIDWRPA
jgi:hypothetical protein